MANAGSSRSEHDQVASLETSHPEWLRAHRALSRLARERAAADAEEGRWLLAALRATTHVHLGFGSFAEYIERSFGYRPRTTREKLRVAEALEMLPATSRALRGGTLSWCAAREVTRVAVPDTEHAWLASAQRMTVRELEDLVAGKTLGDTPNAPHRPETRHHVLRFEVSADTYATFREAVDEVRRASGATLDDDATLLELARHVLGGPTDPGRASYQIALSVCSECGHGEQFGHGQRVAVSSEVIAMARCDGQELGHIAGSAANDNLPSADGADVDDIVQGLKAPANDASAIAERRAAHVGQGTTMAPAGRTTSAPRTTQTIPPALRRKVLLRDERRCRVPGCANVLFLDIHHIVPRSEGGQNEPRNLITVCGVHHRNAHRGELVISGDAADTRFRHADGSAYGSSFDAVAAATYAKVFGALRGLGFREAEVKRTLAELRGASATAATTTTPESLLRQALLRLTPASVQQ